MASLRERMADNGFESNDDYSYHVKCLLGSHSDDLRTLNVEGAPGRRKTAFASALANSLDYTHVLYHDFSRDNVDRENVVEVETEDADAMPALPPVSRFDQIMSDACAFSEGDPTIVILDQLQAAPFAEHIRLYNFICSKEWHSADTQFYANKQKLLVFLISESRLYHSLQKHSFRVWVNDASLGNKRYRAADFQLNEEIQGVIDSMHLLFTHIGVMPTHSEFARLLNDIQLHVRTRNELIHSIFGWTEGIEQSLLHSPELESFVDDAIAAVEDYIGVDEVEITESNFSVIE
ncbi:MAG: hypothetical protein AAF434_07620 [Pseudomonadota bacterium]